MYLIYEYIIICITIYNTYFVNMHNNKVSKEISFIKIIITLANQKIVEQFLIIKNYV